MPGWPLTYNPVVTCMGHLPDTEQRQVQCRLWVNEERTALGKRRCDPTTLFLLLGVEAEGSGQRGWPAVALELCSLLPLPFPVVLTGVRRGCPSLAQRTVKISAYWPQCGSHISTPSQKRKYLENCLKPTNIQKNNNMHSTMGEIAPNTVYHTSQGVVTASQ